jgi:hypothetical protein
VSLGKFCHLGVSYERQLSFNILKIVESRRHSIVTSIRGTPPFQAHIKELSEAMAPSSEPPSGTSTPRSFANQTSSAEDLLKSQTVGLVNLSDFRKRRAEVLELKEKEAQDRTYGKFKPSTSRSTTPALENASDG